MVRPVVPATARRRRGRDPLAHRVDAGSDRRLERPYVAGPAQEVEARAPRRRCRSPHPGRGGRSALPCSRAGRGDAVDGVRNCGCSNSPGMPSEALRSKCPTQRQSTPSPRRYRRHTPRPMQSRSGRRGRFVRSPPSSFSPTDSRVPVVVMRDAERDAAPAGGMYLREDTSSARLVGRVDHRHHHGLRAHVGGARDLIVCLGGHAHDRRELRRLEISHRTLDRLEAEAGMLGVEQDEIAAGASQDMADAGSCELDDEMAEFTAGGCGRAPLGCSCFLPFEPACGRRLCRCLLTLGGVGAR